MTIVCTALIIMLLAFSDAAMTAARTALGCFGTGVLPALLPMMILGKIMPSSAKATPSGKNQWFSSVLFSWAAGSPASAQRAAQLNSHLSAKGWEGLLCLTGVISPMFFTGTLAGWLANSRDGWKLLGIHWLGAAVTAILWTLFSKPSAGSSEQDMCSAPSRIRLPEIIAQCAQSLLCVLGAMMTFSVAASLLKSILSLIFPAWTAQHADWLAVLWAVMEIGGGSSAVISEIHAPHAVLSALCGFGGLSIFLQNMLFLDGKIRPVRLLLIRAVHGTVSYLLVKTLNPF